MSNNKFNSLPPLRKWIISNKYFIKCSDTNKENKASATHYLLDGGIWKVPMDKYQEFLQLLSVDLTNGEYYYISENRTKVFRFICDLDFYDDSIITIPQIERVVNIIQEIIQEYYSDKLVIICGTESKTVTIDSNEYTKTGFHLVWPKIWITVEHAKELRIKFIEKLTSTFGQRDLVNSWEEVVDLAVYEDNGLRMIGCRKMSPCKKCNSNECEKCHGTGRIDEGRVYKPKSVISTGSILTNSDYLKTIQNDYYITLLETSICNYFSFDETPLIKELPINDSTSTVTTKHKMTIKNKDELTKKIENFIRKIYKTNHSNVNIKKVTKVEQTKYLVEPNNNFCMNVDRNHTSSGIYFQIRPTGISQRCFCKKHTTEGRIAGSCKDYCSKEMPLTKQLQVFLFGNTIVKKKKQIINFNLTNENENVPVELKRTGSSPNIQSCLNNCKNILWQLENELIK